MVVCNYNAAGSVGTVGVLLNQAPYLTLSGPASGSAGAGVVLAGHRLAGATRVTFTSASQVATTVPASSFTSTNYAATPNTIGLAVPASLAAGPYALTVTTPLGTSPKTTFTVTTALATTAGLTAESLHIFPNPARATATVLGPAVAGAATATLRLCDALGRPVRTLAVPLPATGLRQPLDLRGLAPGVYWLQVQAGAGWVSRRLLVE